MDDLKHKVSLIFLILFMFISLFGNKEVRMDVGLEGTAIDKASQDDRKLASSEDCLRKTNQSKTKKVHEDASAENTSTDKAPQDGCGTAEVKIKVEVHGNYRELFEAAVKSEWKVAEKFFDEHPEAMMAKVMTVEKESKTVLEVAVMAAQDQFVENLVSRLTRGFSVDILESALKNAASRGRVRMIKALINQGCATPGSVSHALSNAIKYAPMRKEAIWYLVERTTSVPFPTMVNLIMAGHLDIVLHLALRHDSATWENIEKIKLVKDLAKMASYFRSGARLTFWEKCFYKCIPLCLVDTSFDKPKDMKLARAPKQFMISLWNLVTKPAPFIKRIGESKLRHKCSFEFANLALSEKKTGMITPEILGLTSEILLEAASHGISEIVELCLGKFPELMWDKKFAKKLMQEVINGRQVELFRLANAHLSDGGLTKKGLMKAVIKWTPRCVSPDISGAAFLMQRELQWYKVVEDRTEPSMKSLKLPHCQLTKPDENKTYWEVFVEQRQDLLKEAGKWMKVTSSSCSLVATLIITIAFTAAFTVPGGNDGMGIPIFLKKSSFMVFVIADALALFSSVTATLMFLAILTSHYTIEDFLHSLPSKMILGLTFLFLSLGSMMVAFGFALTIVLNGQLKWIYILVTLLVALPIVLFAMLQLPLYFEMVISTFRPRLYRPKRLWNCSYWMRAFVM